MSSDREKITQAAQKWVDKKRYDRAIEEYQKLVRLDPNDARTLLKIGDLQARMQSFDQAIATYDRVGQFYHSQGFALKAIAVYKQIRELIRKHAPAQSDRYGYVIPRLAEIYSQLGLTSDALAAWDEVAARHQRNGQEHDAIEVFRKMVSLDSTNPLPYLRLAEACCRVQDLDEAIDAFWTAAELLMKLDRREDALKVVERILHFRQDPKYARLSAQLYLQKNRREDGLQALAKLQIAFQADPRDLDTLSLLAQAFTVIGQEDKAIEVYKEMARIAREGERQDLFEQLVTHLQQVAPHDEGVRALLSSVPPVAAAPAVEPSAVHVDDEDVEIVEEERPEAPFALNRQSRPGIRPFQASAPDVVVVDAEIEAAEEYGESQAPGDDYNTAALVHKAMVDAEAFRKLRLYGKALETVQIGLEIDARAIDLREKLRELLIESGDRDGAIGESITLAALYLDAGNASRAEALLYEVLEVEPQHAAALEMIAQISSGLEQQWSPGDGPTETHEQAGFGDDYAQRPSVDVSYEPAENTYEVYESRGPLPSYDLEEVSASSAMASPHALQAPDDMEMDDPFAPSRPEAAPAPLPSFPLGAEDESVVEISAVEVFPEQETTAPQPDEAAEAFDEGAPTGIAEAPSTEAIEEALEEAEFFASRGLYDDAKAIITDQLARAPGHPLLLERIREIEHLIAASVESVTIDRSQLGARIEEPPDRSFDIAASLGALDSLEPPPAPSSATGGSSVGDLDVDKVFLKFKEGVRAQVSENDTATHYDLGVAYKEMGLLADAINEFDLAARDPARECMCHAMVGMIRLERGELDLAAKAYIRGLEAPQKTVDQEMALYYDLGNVYEMKGIAKDALYYFQKVARRDPGYRGVSDRIAALQPGAPPSAQKAANDDEDFDRVFDDLFESKG